MDRFKSLSKDPDNWQAALKPDYVAEAIRAVESLEEAADAALGEGNDGIYMALQQRLRSML